MWTFVHVLSSSIAPDCGNIPQITHFTPTGEKNAIRSQEFFNKYMENELKEDKRAFYLGYYIHLLVDTAWWNCVWIPASIKFAQEIEQDREFIKKIKKSWKSIDYLFLSKNKDFKALKLIEKTKSFRNVYLDFYSEDIFESMITSFKSEYNFIDAEISESRLYLSYAGVSSVIEKIVCEIENILSGNNILFYHA